MARMAFTTTSDLCSWGKDGIYLFDSENLDELVKSGMVEISQSETKYRRSISIKLDKLRALKLLGDWLNMWKGQARSQTADDLTKVMNEIGMDPDIRPYAADKPDSIH